MQAGMLAANGIDGCSVKSGCVSRRAASGEFICGIDDALSEENVHSLEEGSLGRFQRRGLQEPHFRGFYSAGLNAVAQATAPHYLHALQYLLLTYVKN